MFYVGICFVVLGLCYLTLKVYIAYDTGRGIVGMTAVLDGVIFPPVLIITGMQGIMPSLGFRLPPWSLPLILVVLWTVCWIGIEAAAKLGEKNHNANLRQENVTH